MNIKEMIEVLQAAERGETIEFKDLHRGWIATKNPAFDFGSYKYRVTPKPQMTLVEELRRHKDVWDLNQRAADEIIELRLAVHNRDNRLEELEKYERLRITKFTTSELLDELKRRTSC